MEHFSKKELQYLLDTDFLLTKAHITQKVKDLLAQVEQGIKQQIDHFQFPSEVLTLSGKVSRGENYQRLPYLILDYPRKFNNEEIFAFRTMFWWGHSFSTTLHLGGKHWDEQRAGVIDRQMQLTGDDLYVCINESPWQYHYQSDNYVLWDDLQEVEQISLLQSHPFLKVSKRWDLTNPKFATQAVETFAKMMKLISLH